MASTRTKKVPKSREKASVTSQNGADVFTLEEAAAYLRVAESELEQLAAAQEIPAQRIGAQWRFLKSALERWLGGPTPHERLMSHAGAGRDDPYREQMLKEIYKRRGRPMIESSK